MSAEFSIRTDVCTSVINIVMKGFFDADDIARFLAARAAAHAELRCAPNAHCTINDVREMKIQAQEIVGAFQAMLADPAYRSRKLAFVTAPTLARPQLLRAIGSRGARAWVLAANDTGTIAA